MVEDEPMAISAKLDELIARTREDPREALAALVRRYGVARTAVEARIAIGSWRTRIDFVEDKLNEVLVEHAHDG